ncbi:MAG: hypothetical protein ABJN40_00775 [Sneathiella sp.]
MFIDIYRSFRRLPLWVQIWVVFWLAPMNMGGLFFLDHTLGLGIAVLGIVGMLPNMIIIVVERGFSPTMALPHLIPWTLLVLWLIIVMTGEDAPDGSIALYIWALIVTDILSLFFDYRDSFHWLKGKRDIA